MKYNKLILEGLLRGYGIMHRWTKYLYKYRYEKYGEFPGKKSKIHAETSADLVVYCFWTGNNEMSNNRKINLKETINNVGVPLVLVTPENLRDYIKEGFPLHPSFPFLSDVHKSDYLRCYFMHHWGGGYTDVKKQNRDWKDAMTKLNRSRNKIALGYREFYWGVSKIQKDTPGSELLNKDLQRHFAYLMGNGAFIFKPYSNFTKDWITEVHRRLDRNMEYLKNSPGNVLGDNEGYPIAWTYILGQIFHPLCLKYHKEILFDDDIKPDITNYR